MGWIGVDLDGTLAHYEGWKGSEHIGEPVPRMAERVKDWLREGKDVRIFTGRVSVAATRNDKSSVSETIERIRDWTEKHFGKRLEVTCVKDFEMIVLWDDRCVAVEKNTGVQK